MQEQFFSVTHTTPVNVIPMPTDFNLPTLEALDAELPEPFRIASVYCYAEVKHLEAGEHGIQVLLDYVRIREDDRELPVRASLHVQSKRLKLRAQERQC